MSDKTYRVNEVFYSVQGEGALVGTPMVFIRLSRCNLRCSMEPGEKSPGGFDCDTEFESGRRLTLGEILGEVLEALDEGLASVAGLVGVLRSGEIELHGLHPWLLLTGGEPALQVDTEFCEYFRSRGFRLAIETNGSMLLPKREMGALWRPPDMCIDDELTRFPFDHITVSPKVAEHAVRQLYAHELRYVRAHGQSIPEPRCQALQRFISPAWSAESARPFEGLTAADSRLSRETRDNASWCVDLVKSNPDWRLSLQTHKLLGVR